ncbi:MAG: hypothetical protein A2504_08770 [Bdellovibrionales bacterium RIFOXYD12_FULL_39_22]|nr:MAG: hypothetical protein A2385_05110 [Bdellovibrionales bacterium RIFOXYB1_FULL_39_21]OFZ43358.1 MAG: hypothetical protein A2485_13640 [Bdellovibrionales bacterium RIFOXYC12_FULL_39_17]OFZ47417.1 MAG: hypothetical protein A2404_13140 [Bdellovibrionales bacterium RIFOXYC1_FULL_39_130]OFZ70453.1 MAG: hypothetical protein A2451_10980 [Bdellovibrionales bacterium RIFOXYC2_FULL_39_8]OFZ76297.1 MAG: hypothetical protein A2560_17280 [Bdellovibrionales bacterium RIFOXYD1_FULL_39_84]OFZ94335.1 MAG:
MKLVAIYKLIALCAISFSVFFYADYKKGINEQLNNPAARFILQKMPAFTLNVLNGTYAFDGKQEIVSSDTILNGTSQTLFIHFWATWCAPCLDEMPSLLKYAKSVEESKKMFLLVAAQNERIEVLKFIKKINIEIPKNVIIASDNEGDVMLKFGTVKVPETYVFDQNGQIMHKMIGQQEWSDNSFVSRF